MNKIELIEKYKKPEDKLLVSKILDKIDEVNRKNIVSYTDFLDMYEQRVAKYVLNSQKLKYVLFGGFDNASRVMAIIYPDKITEDIIKKSYNNYMKIVRIKLPKILNEKYKHKDYLSGIMKLGIKREKFGDIIVNENGADIIVEEKNVEYVYQNIKQLTRFSKCEISVQNIENIALIDIRTEVFKIVVPHLRLDSIVSKLANTSRVKASEIITEGRVFINYEECGSQSKEVKPGDIIVVRGKGKFEIGKIEGTTRKCKGIITVKKYV